MLHEKFRYIDKIALVYKYRGLKRTDISEYLGYSKKSRWYYRLRKKLKGLGILSEKGTFVENPLNLTLVRMYEGIQNTQMLIELGNRTSYCVFFALHYGEHRNPTWLSRDLHVSPQSVFSAVKRLKRVQLVENRFKMNTENADAVAFVRLFDSYVQNAIEWVNLNPKQQRYLYEISPLTYLDSTEAHVAQYPSARTSFPMGDILIKTAKPFFKFWYKIIEEVDYFRGYPKKIDIQEFNPNDKIVFLYGAPFKKYNKSDHVPEVLRDVRGLVGAR